MDGAHRDTAPQRPPVARQALLRHVLGHSAARVQRDDLFTRLLGGVLQGGRDIGRALHELGLGAGDAQGVDGVEVGEHPHHRLAGAGGLLDEFVDAAGVGGEEVVECGLGRHARPAAGCGGGPHQEAEAGQDLDGRGVLLAAPVEPPAHGRRCPGGVLDGDHVEALREFVLRFGGSGQWVPLVDAAPGHDEGPSLLRGGVTALVTQHDSPYAERHPAGAPWSGRPHPAGRPGYARLRPGPCSSAWPAADTVSHVMRRPSRPRRRGAATGPGDPGGRRDHVRGGGRSRRAAAVLASPPM